MQGCLDQRLHGGEPGIAPPDELFEVGNKVGDGRRSWVDRHQPFVNRDESQVHGAGFAVWLCPGRSAAVFIIRVEG